MNLQIKTILASILFVLISTVCVAQPTPCGEEDGLPPCETPTAPIDGLTTVFVLIGVVYGIRKTIENSRKHQL